MYYEKKLAVKDAHIKEIILLVMGTQRKGRKKVIPLVQKQDPNIGQSRIRRVYQNEGLSLRSRMCKQRPKKDPNPMEKTFARNEEWAMDFMHDSLSNGRAIRTLTLVDHYNRQCLGIEIAHSISARKVIGFLELMIATYGKPKRIRTDNGPEFTSKFFQVWLEKNHICWSPIQNGKPQQNAIVERFNRTYREEVLNVNIFDTIEDIKRITQQWMLEYNGTRPHESLANLTPLEYAA
jgi:putative transposase